MKKGEELKARNNRLISESKHPLLEQLLRLLRIIIINAVQLPPSFRALGFRYVDLCDQVWLYNSREMRFHMIKQKEKL